MKTFFQLMRNTPRDVQARAREVSVSNLRSSHAIRKTMKAMVFQATCNAITEKTFYDIYVELFPHEHQVVRDPDGKGAQPRVFDKPSLDLPCFIFCSCPYFLFTLEFALWKSGNSEIKYSNGKPPRVTNPTFSVWLCKHLFASGPPIIRIMEKSAAKDDRSTYNYV